MLIRGVVGGVRQSVHALRGGEDVVVVREDVMAGESYELAAIPEHAAEEVERVEGVGEVGKDSNHNPVVDDLLDLVHPWRSPGRWPDRKSIV